MIQSKRNRDPALAATRVLAVAMAAVLVSGCGAVSWVMNDGVSNPITPEQSQAQVMDAAKASGIKAVSAFTKEAAKP